MIIFVIAIAAVALGGAMYYRTSTETTTTPEATTTEEVGTTSNISEMLDAAEGAADAMEQGMGSSNAELDAAEVPTTDESDTTYADGTYTKTGMYVSPAGQETVTVTVTLEGDVITDATFVGNATNPGSINNQAKFAAGYNALVVGKSIDAVALTVVNGSSLTGIGFMDALDAIKDDAKL